MLVLVSLIVFFNLFKAGFPLVTIILVNRFVERMKSKIKCKYWLLILYRLQFVGPSLFQRMHSGSVQLQLKEKKLFFSLEFQLRPAAAASESFFALLINLCPMCLH